MHVGSSLTLLSAEVKEQDLDGLQLTTPQKSTVSVTDTQGKCSLHSVSVTCRAWGLSSSTAFPGCGKKPTPLKSSSLSAWTPILLKHNSAKDNPGLKSQEEPLNDSGSETGKKKSVTENYRALCVCVKFLGENSLTNQSPSY